MGVELMKKRKKGFYSREIVLGDLLHDKEFDSFDELRKEANKTVAIMRENWLKECLRRHGYEYKKKDHTEREIKEMFLANGIQIVRKQTNKKDTDMVIMSDKVIGEWDNSRKIRIDLAGKLLLTIRYYIKR
jgi:hypothetical protein